MLLEAKDISYAFFDDKICFKNLSFSLNRNENLAILGLNGQGKTTLLLNLMGFYKPKTGYVKIYDTFSFLSQNLNVSFDYNVIDTILLGRASSISLFSSPSKKDFDIAMHFMDILDIVDLKNKKFNSLSGGQKQLVLFAKALVGEGKILFLDEPASALDLKNQDKILSLIQKLNKQLNISVIFTTHQPNHAQAIANKTIILYRDGSCDFGDTNEVLNEYNQKMLYGIDIKNVSLNILNNNLNVFVPIFSSQISKNNIK